MPRLTQALTLLALATSALGASAQPPGDEHTRALHLAARNQLGLMEYCQAQGMVGADAVAAQRDIVAHLPPVLDTATGETEEAAGRLGYLAFDRRQATFADSAMAQGITLRLACEGRAATVLTAANR